MADKKIFSVPVDSAEFDAFADRFMQYQAKLEQQPEAWAGTSKGIKNTQKELKAMSSAFDAVVNKSMAARGGSGVGGGKGVSIFDKFSKAAKDPKLSGDRSFVRTFLKDSKESDRAWENIAKSLEKSSRFAVGLSRGVLGFGMFGGALGAVAGGAADASVSGAQDLADKNRRNREIGLKPGESEGFSSTYGTDLGLNDDFLAKIASIKANRSRWSELVRATGGRVTNDQIQNENTLELGENAVQYGAEAYRQFGGQWAESQGANSLFGEGALRNAAGREPGFFDDERARAADSARQQAFSQSDADKASKIASAWDTALGNIKTKMETALLPLADDFTTLAGGVGDAIKAFSDSGELQSDVQTFESAVHDLAQDAKWISDHLNSLFGLTGKKPKPGESQLYNAEQGSFAANVAQTARNLWGFTFDGKSTSQFETGPGRAIGMGGGGTGTDDGAATDNNIGNLKNAGGSGFQSFGSIQAGAKAMRDQLLLYQNRDHLQTLSQIISKWAPPSENDDAAYIDDVSKRTGYKPDQKLDLSDPAVLTRLESAMATHEKGSKYADQLTPDKIGSYLNDAAKRQSPFDEAPKIIPYDGANPDYQDIDGFKVVPYDDGATPSKKGTDTPDTDSYAAQFKARLSAAGDVIGDAFSGIFSAGAGSQFRSPDASARTAQPSNQAPIGINVNVTAPAGSSTNVTVGSLPQ